jgi:ubiquinone/menaquinone biosynthesis C-methylase UbiE
MLLDLGCGSRQDLASWGVTAADEVTGLDIDDGRLAIAKVRFSNRPYLPGAGECLPFEDEGFDRVISALALPYMNISENAGRNSPHPRSWRRFVAKVASPEFHDS